MATPVFCTFEKIDMTSGAFMTSEIAGLCTCKAIDVNSSLFNQYTFHLRTILVKNFYPATALKKVKRFGTGYVMTSTEIVGRMINLARQSQQVAHLDRFSNIPAWGNKEVYQPRILSSNPVRQKLARSEYDETEELLLISLHL